MTANKINRKLFLLIAISTLVRGILAAMLEFGNDEVYYWTYALYPDWSHFDHPPMVGWVINFFSFGLSFQDEFFIRLGSVILGAANTLLIFQIGRFLKDALTGWYAALLYTASIYCFIITGVFIMPDSPQIFFWLISLFLMLRANRNFDDPLCKCLFVAGLSIGLAMMSKYTSVFLWIGYGAYVLFFDRRWLRKPALYLGPLISLGIFLPVLLWNIKNEFISFTFHSGRVGLFSDGIHFDYFFRELFGQMLYNNPVNFVIIILALVAYFKGRKYVDRNAANLLLLTSLPLIVLFLFFSLFRPTLPHWTGPAYLSLILMAAAWLRSFQPEDGDMKVIPKAVIAALGLTAVVVVLGFLQINYGLLYNGKEEVITERGKMDVSLDMYGWQQTNEAFSSIYQSDLQSGEADSNTVIFSHRWFPAANLDYYVARPNGMDVLVIGELDAIHKYYWINELRGGIKTGMDGYYITGSRDYAGPERLFGETFESYEPIDTIAVMRSGKIVEYKFFYRLK